MTDSILAPGPRIEPIVSPRGQPVPVTLLTGFLGAGKTTLLNRILNGDHGLRVGVLVNDFGQVNIDAALIEGVEENTISLSNGCVCCEVRDDLVTSLEDLLQREEAVDYVIVEASGVADPEGVVMTFLDAKYEQLLRLDSITCLVDADGVLTHKDNAQVMMLKLRQIGFSDLVILNKIDLVSHDEVLAIRDWIGSHFNRIRIMEAEHCDVPYEILLSVGRFDPSVVEASGVAHSTADGTGFETWHYRTDAPVSLPAVREMIRRLPGTIFRCKGIIRTADDPDRRTVIQSVGRRTTLSDAGPWGDTPPQSDIVVIGLPGTLDPGALKAMFDECRV